MYFSARAFSPDMNVWSLVEASPGDGAVLTKPCDNLDLCSTTRIYTPGGRIMLENKPKQQQPTGKGQLVSGFLFFALSSLKSVIL